MALREPKSMDELVYMTLRDMGSGTIRAWVYKGTCPSCKKGVMAKPRDAKTGRPKIRAQEYVCAECNHTEEKKAHEETLSCDVIYTCPHCGKSGETSVPYKRKKFKKVDAVVFTCNDCGEKIPIMKKMKEGKD